MAILDLEQQLTFYASYHHTKSNIIIHLFGVPAIMCTTFLLAGNLPAIPAVPTQYLPSNLPLNPATLLALGYSTFYILLEPLAGALLAPLIIMMTAYTNSLTSSDDPSVVARANLVAVSVWIAGWAAQFVGHGVFEKRAPALLDSFIQALVLAPFFVWFEVLFWCGYRPHLRARVEEGVLRRLEEFKEGDGKAKAKAKGKGKGE